VRAAVPWLLAASFGIHAGCAREPTPLETVLQFQQAVQAGDLDGLFCLSAGAVGADELGRDPGTRRAGFRAWATARLEQYLAGRDRGRVEPDGDAIVTVKLLALGRGTFFEFEPVRHVGAEGLRVPVSLRLGYAQLDLSRFSPGTTFYLSGAPLGTVHAVRVPWDSREIRLEVLDRITIEWTLIRQSAGDGCPGGWAVAAVEPLAGTEATTEITWVF